MDDSHRFSILLLEKDVMEYVNAKNKYREYEERVATCEPKEREDLKRKKSFWYKKYITKMKYLETHYRKTNVYTEYHRGLENPVMHQPLDMPEVPMAIATVVPPASPTAHIPSAPLYNPEYDSETEEMIEC